MKRITIILFFCFGRISLNAQDVKQEEEKSKPRHSMSILLTHVHSFEGRDSDGNRKTLSLPGWGFSYDYYLTPQWKLGIHSDITIEKFIVEKDLGNGDEIERIYPVALALVTTYKMTKHWGVLLGVGGEFERDENFFLARVGLQYSGELPKEWEVFGKVSYDMRLDAYDTWTIGIGIAKLFGCKGK